MIGENLQVYRSEIISNIVILYDCTCLYYERIEQTGH